MVLISIEYQSVEVVDTRICYLDFSKHQLYYPVRTLQFDLFDQVSWSNIREEGTAHLEEELILCNQQVG